MPGDKDEPFPASEDFRSRTARRRRRDTKQRLLTALFELIDQKGCDDLSVDDLRRECDLSRGAFYRYFPTLEAMLFEASAAVGGHINREMSARFDGELDVARRMSRHARYFTERAASDRACALLLLRTMPFTMAVSDAARDHATEDFRQAQAAGQLDFADLEVAVELGHGMQLATLRRAVIHGFDAAKLSAAMTVMLRGFGLDGANAVRLANEPMPEIERSDLRMMAIAGMAVE